MKKWYVLVAVILMIGAVVFGIVALSWINGGGYHNALADATKQREIALDYTRLKWESDGIMEIYYEQLAEQYYQEAAEIEEYAQFFVRRAVLFGVCGGVCLIGGISVFVVGKKKAKKYSCDTAEA